MDRYLELHYQQWKERLNDLRRKPGSHSHDGVNDKPDRGTAGTLWQRWYQEIEQERDGQLLSFQEQNQSLQDIKQRVIRASESFARYRRTALPDRTAKSQNRTVGKRESAMAGINAEAEQREQLITDIKQQIEKARDIDERMRKLRERRAGGRTPGNDGTDAGRTGSERPDDSGTEQAAKKYIEGIPSPFCYYLLTISFSISARSGITRSAPFRVVILAAAAFANVSIDVKSASVRLSSPCSQI